MIGAETEGGSMDPQAAVLRLPGLTDDAAIELEEVVGKDVVTLEREEIPEGAFGDLGLTTAIVLLSAVALRGLTSYLVLRHRGKSFKQKIEVVTATGDRVITEVDWKDSSGEPVEAALAEALGSVPGLDAAALLGRSP
jgi:hypothetical protein